MKRKSMTVSSRTTRRALGMNFLSLLLCVSMLIGTTFAWFTDSVTSGRNQIIAGNLDVEVDYSLTGNGSDWATLQNAANFYDGVKWEPGVTEVVYLRVTNKGDMAFDYKMQVTPVSETGGVNQAGDSFKLSDYLIFGTTAPSTDLTVYAKDGTGRAQARTACTNTTQGLVDPILTGQMTTRDEVKYFALVIYMPDTVDNVANYRTGTTPPSIDLQVNVLATQMEHESDSFDKTYDAGAVTVTPYNVGPTWEYYPQITVTTPVAENGATSITKTGKFAETDETEVEMANISVPKGAIKDGVSELSLSLTATPPSASSAETAGLRAEIENSERETANFNIFIDGIKEDNTEDISIQICLGKGLANVKLYHNGTEMSYDSYDPATGILSFRTKSFSDYTAAYDTAAAAVDNQTYGSLALAVAAVQSGGTVSLLKNVALTEAFEINTDKSFILNLNEKTVSGRINLKRGNVTVANGTVAGGNKQAINVYGSAESTATNYSVLTIASDATVTADNLAVCVFGETAATNGYGAVVNLNGTVATTGDGTSGAVFVSGNLGNNINSADSSNIINIGGSVTSGMDCAVALNGLAVVNVKTGAALTGNTAVTVKRGTLNMLGGSVTATGARNEPGTDNNNGTEMTGAAISVTNTYNQYGPLAVNISGGTITSANGSSLFVENDTYTTGKTIAVTGGTFSGAVTAAGESGFISGGSFNTEPDEANIDSAFEVVQKEDDSYGIQQSPHYLKFTANKDNSFVQPRFEEGRWRYSTDGGVTWQDGTLTSTKITLAKAGDSVLLSGIGCKTRIHYGLNNLGDYTYFKMGGSIAASGDVTSLTNGVGGDAHLTVACYAYMFYNCTALTSAPALPSTVAPNYCYDYMFCGCTSLTTPPELAATELWPYCYKYMFYGCTSLTAAPALPATTLADSCYYAMFRECTSLTTAPTLPATTLANYCYHYMFSSCTSLTTVPDLLATTLAVGCCMSMFSGCIKLTAAPALPATTLAKYCYESMFFNCNSLTSAPELPATELSPSCYQNMFNGCYLLTAAPTLPATTLASNCYDDMFANCHSLTTAPALPATTLANQCYLGMFRNCSKLTTAPDLPATTLAEGCYMGMFEKCKALTTAPALPATTLEKNCYASMFSECKALVSAPALPATTLADKCYSAMFNGCTSLYVSDSAVADTATYAWSMGEITQSGDYAGLYMFTGCAGTRSSNDMAGAVGETYTYYTQNAPVTAQ